MNGPAAATYASLRRIGWNAVSFDVWMNPDNTRVPLESVSVKDARTLLSRDAVDHCWREAAERRSAYNGLMAKPLTAPICQLLAARPSEN